MKRDIYHQLQDWKHSSRRKPLILRGARQVGKTHILRSFAKNEYEDYLYINFDEQPQFANFFSENLDPDRILKDLGIHFKKNIIPEKTLIIFDEIQECPNALNSLKYFCEKKNEYHIASAGSLLGVKLGHSFPVGKVNFLNLNPFSFFEFLNAINEPALRELLETHKNPTAINTTFHNKLIKLLKHYFIIGGMPEAIDAYVQNENFDDVRASQKEILDAYILDFAKHAPKEDLPKIMAVWNLIPSQLAKENKKFIFSAIKKSARSRNYEAAIQWLKDAGLIIKSFNITTPNFPLEAYANQQAFKVFTLDVGLLSAMSNLSPQIILEDNKLFKEFKGALTENFVATELLTQHLDQLYYWTNPKGHAEIDFVIAKDQQVFPLEVKAGLSRQKKSLLVYGEKYQNEEFRTPILSRATLRNFDYNGNIVNYPLYAACLFPRFYGDQLKK